MSLSKDGGCGLSGKHTKIKIERTIIHVCYVDPSYETKPNIIFDRKTKLSRQVF
jgi:hypothetical protein